MADADRLQIAEGRDDGDNHLLELLLLPECTALFALAEHVLQVGATVHVLANHGDSVCVIHRLVKVVAKELEYVRVTLHLVQLHCFFLFKDIANVEKIKAITYFILIELVECLCFDLFNRIVLSGWYVLGLVDLSILFT